jgi:hypothetical protein
MWITADPDSVLVVAERCESHAKPCITEVDRCGYGDEIGFGKAREFWGKRGSQKG